jgi:hypothetical protein
MNVFEEDNIVSPQKDLSILKINIGENSKLFIEKSIAKDGVANRVSYMWFYVNT